MSIWAPMARLAQVTLTVDARRTGTDLAGSWNAEVSGGAKSTGALSGTLTDEAAIRAAQSFAAGADWPGYHGPHGGNRATDTKTPLLDDLARIRPVWRAEQPVLSGWGSGADSRYAHRAALGTVNGGTGTPVFANGRIYLFHYVPSGDPDPAKLAALLEQAGKSFPDILPAERAGLTDFLRPFSDTIVTCLDAQTGGTLWRTTIPRLSGNFQTHKWRGINPTACIIGNTVIAADYGHNVVALNAATGEVRWTLPGKQVVQGDSAPRGALPAGKLALLQGGGLRAVQPDTGDIVWKGAAGSYALVWGKPGVERVLALSGKALTCLDAATGKQLWTAEAELQAAHGSAALLEGDILVGHVIDKGAKDGRFQGWRLSDTEAKKLWEDEPLTIDENLTVSLASGRAYLAGKDEIRCLDLATGKLLGKQTGFATGQGPGSNQWLAVVGNRLLLAPEGQHGRQGFHWLDAGPSLKLLSHWTPPNNHTTAYAYFPLGFPVVDGRLFVRGMDGIYCYDLRQPGTNKR
ncbi:MAG: PQQ-binding-like beta-propeller repeat protein [Planctomycetia bacterium]|nr:PQQ-binding-like beta-propeller repeat protein [Planctomycetia bacterium]